MITFWDSPTFTRRVQQTPVTECIESERTQRGFRKGLLIEADFTAIRSDDAGANRRLLLTPWLPCGSNGAPVSRRLGSNSIQGVVRFGGTVGGIQ